MMMMMMMIKTCGCFTDLVMYASALFMSAVCVLVSAAETDQVQVPLNKFSERIIRLCLVLI